MDINQQKEQFSLAYIKAVSSVAGFSLHKPSVDDDSVDIVFAQTGGNGTIRSPRIDAQLKCTSRDVIRENWIKFTLSLKNYNDLRPENVLVPRILVVVIVPSEIDNWLEQSPEKLSMHHCGYWTSLRGLPETENETSVNINIPLDQVFSVNAIQTIMNRVEEGGLP